MALFKNLEAYRRDEAELGTFNARRINADNLTALAAVSPSAITWTSSSPTIASVPGTSTTLSNTATGHAAGTTTITVAANGYTSGTTKITVTAS